MLTRALQSQLLDQLLNKPLGTTRTDSLRVKKALGPDLPKIEGTADAVVMFVDIAGFSQTIKGWDPLKVRTYLAKFYTVAIKAIDDHQGLIDRIVGDGIVAVFSQFLDSALQNPADQALTTAEYIITQLRGTICESKAAIGCGQVLFCNTGLAGVYTDYTVLGAPLTHVYRMEEQAKRNQILVPVNSPVGAIIQRQLKARQEHVVRAQLTGASVNSVVWDVQQDDAPLRGAEELGTRFVQTRIA